MTGVQFNVVTRRRQTEQPSQRRTLERRRQQKSRSMPCHTALTVHGASEDYCFIGGEMAAHESPVLVMMDTETSMVFARVCKRKGADPDISATHMEDI